MKKINKILISLAMVLMFALPVLLTGCGAASAQEIANITNAVTSKFSENYSSYNNHKNITYKTIKNIDNKKTLTLSYKENEEDTEFKTGTFTNITKDETSTTYSFKRMDDEDLALYVKIKGKSSKTEYEVENDTSCLIKIKNITSYTDEYILSFTKDEEGNKTYYIINNYVNKESGEEEYKENLYYNISRENYVGYIESAINLLKTCAVNSFFFTTSAFEWQGLETASIATNFTGKNGKVTASYKFNFPIVNYEDDYLETLYESDTVTSSFTKNGLDKAKAELTFIKEDDEESVEEKTTQEMIVLTSANGKFKIPSLDEFGEGYEVVGYVEDIVLDDIPESITNIFPLR